MIWSDESTGISEDRVKASPIATNEGQFIGEIILKLSVFLYSCLAIAYLCDQYFVPSLEYLGEAFHLPPDITGAILIPIGTSGPEIFSSAISVFFTSNDIGTGAIIGSAVFNLLAIPAACGLAVAYYIGRPVKLEALPILRDLLFYILSIIVLILVIKDNRVDLDDCDEKLTIERSESTPLLNDKTIIVLQQLATNCDANYGNSGKLNPLNVKSGYEEIVDQKMQFEDNDDNESSIMNNCFCSLILSPVYIVFWVTMPKRWKILTFVVSIGWLTGLSYCTVWAISGFSDALAIPQTISGMTLLAAGSAGN
ncbi:unnamed protein product [Oppiella nova]|uniref:Sodium/calcium exchanger membrane region domain-containing protein n=1 Tax=Oppiella nova TaxID=334625 RepID=A0A7R9LQL9_9ACAR|nr:unnamed protein product [Oppiella nova]CAG2166015.1 unnamed protein product [Oppiella nova]